jgi:hypothetical protein
MSFKVRELVILSTANLRFKYKKLAPKFIRPFRVLNCVGKQAYRLILPDKYALLHNIFPIQLLRK